MEGFGGLSGGNGMRNCSRRADLEEGNDWTVKMFKQLCGFMETVVPETVSIVCNTLMICAICLYHQ